MPNKYGEKGAANFFLGNFYKFLMREGEPQLPRFIKIINNRHLMDNKYFRTIKKNGEKQKKMFFSSKIAAAYCNNCPKKLKIPLLFLESKF